MTLSNRKIRMVRVLAVAAIGLGASSAHAIQIGFEEEFLGGVQGWEDNANDPMTAVTSGGPDGSSYGSAQFDYTGFVAPFPGSGPIVHRAQDEDGASGGAFIGSWAAEGARGLTAWVRHDASEDLSYILRIATASNFPAVAIAADQGPVAAGGWTQLSFDVRGNNPLCSAESFSPLDTCSDLLLFGMGHLQLGVDAPQALIDAGELVTFDIDKVQVIPEPGVATLLGLGLAGIGLQRRARESGSSRS